MSLELATLVFKGKYEMHIVGCFLETFLVTLEDKTIFVGRLNQLLHDVKPGENLQDKINRLISQKGRSLTCKITGLYETPLPEHGENGYIIARFLARCLEQKGKYPGERKSQVTISLTVQDPLVVILGHKEYAALKEKHKKLKFPEFHTAYHQAKIIVLNPSPMVADKKYLDEILDEELGFPGCRFEVEFGYKVRSLN